MLKSAKAIGANTDTASSQAFIFRQPDITFGLLIYGQAEAAFVKIKAAVTSVENYLTGEIESVPNTFKKTLESLAPLLSELDNSGVLLVAWKEDVVYLQSIGEFEAVLHRQTQSISLLTNSDNQQLISGHLQSGDRVVISTKTLTTFLNTLQDSPFDIRTVSLEDFPAHIHELLLDKADASPVSAIILDSEDATEILSRSEIKLNTPSLRPTLPKINLMAYLPKINFPIGFWRRRGKVVTLIVVVSVIAVLAGLGWVAWGQQQKTQQVNRLLATAQNKLDQARSLRDLNPQGAQSSLVEARQVLAEARKLDPDNNQIQQFTQTLNDSTADVLKIYQVTDWPVFLSLDLLNDSFSPNRFSLSMDQLLLYDNSQRTLVMLTLPQKGNSILAGPNQLGNAEAVTINGDFAFAYSERGIVRIDTRTKKDIVAVKPDTEWARIVDIVGFASNIYMLDAGKNQIWKYVPVAAGYSDRMTYFRQDLSVNLSQAKRMLIDSSVWILNQDNSLDKYTSGNQDYFSFSGLDENIQNISTFFLSDETTKLYVIDAKTSRLLVFDKTGAYQAQYSGEKFATAQDLLVDEKGKKIYLLEGNKIYQIDLR